MTHRPAVSILLVFTGGILCQDVLGVGVPLLVLVVLPLAIFLARHQRRWFTPAIFIFVFFLGAFDAWEAGLLPLNHIGRRLDDFKGRDSGIIGRVVSWPHVQSTGLASRKSFLCEIEKINDEAWQGRVVVNLYGAGDVVYGDRLYVKGRLAKPYDPSRGRKNSYAAHLQRQGIYALVYVRKNASRKVLGACPPVLDGMALFCRESLQAVFRRYLSPGEAGLMNAMLLGPRDEIPPYVYDVFRKTGTAHVIAISGMNMSLTAVGLLLVLGMFNISRTWRSWLAVFILGFYSLMAGGGAPVARSAVMAAAVILSFVLERETDGLNNLALAGIVLLAADPGQLHDVGFQLSFVCVAGLILIAPLMVMPLENERWCRKPWAWFLVESMAVTLAAFIGSAGILAYDFGYLAPIGLLVNLPVVPLMGIVTALGFLVLMFGLILPFMAWPFALCLKVILNASVAILAVASHAPVIRFDALPVWGFLLYYVILIGGLFYFYYCTPVHSRAFIDKQLPL